LLNLYETALDIRVVILNLTVALICLQFGSANAQSAADLVLSTEDQLLADAQTAPCLDADRLDAARALLIRYGANETDLKVLEAGKVKNIVLTLKGSEAGYVVVGAHYDKVKDGCGAVDNWTGITVLAHVYKTLRQRPLRRSYIFVAFGGEEEGLQGSKAMVETIAKEDRPSYCAMVNFDSFGLARPQVLTNISTGKLSKLASQVAKKLQIPFASVPVAMTDSDSSSFRRVGIPAVTLHGLSIDWKRIIHTGYDQPKRIKSANLYRGYVLGANLLSELDGYDCAAFR
jgi:hypothetical protein